METFKALRTKNGVWLKFMLRTGRWDFGKSPTISSKDVPERLLKDAESDVGEPVEIVNVLVIPVEEIPTPQEIDTYNTGCTGDPVSDFLGKLADAIEVGK